MRVKSNIVVFISFEILFFPNHSQLCLPNTKPGICDQNTWTQITSQFDGGSCAPPEYLSIPGYDLCLTPDQHTLYGWCKPQYRPAECLSSSWVSIEAIFNGGSCPSKKILIGEDLGALPPDYLFLEDHQKCLKVYQQSGASYQEKCLPKIKPRECSIETWQSLREKFDGIGKKHASKYNDKFQLDTATGCVIEN